MIHFRKNTKLRLVRTVTFVLSVCLVLSCLGLYFDYRLRSVVKDFAKSAVQTAVLDCAAIGAQRALEAAGMSYDELAVVSRNSEGLATSVEIDSVSANKLKNLISSEIAAELAARESVRVSVPLSAAFGVYFTTANWPKLNYTVHITTTVRSNYTSTFATAGINQVLHQILLTVTLESDLGMIEKDTAQVTATEFIIAQTVIVGVVPDAFTSVNNATDEVMEDIFDFGAAAE